MSDEDLENIRRARMQQLQQEQGGRGQGGGSEQESQKYVTLSAAFDVGLTSADNAKVRHDCTTKDATPDARTNQPQADQRTSILAQILTPAAADRLGRIRLVKESRATDIENRLIMLARTGQIRQKVDEEQLKGILGAVAEQSEREESKIKVERRGGGGWDEDEELEALMREV